MNPLLNFAGKTIKGGIFFLIPIALMVILFNKVLQLLRPLAKWLSKFIDPDNNFTFDLAYLIATVLLIAICFCFGLIGSLRGGKSMIKWLEDKVLIIIPGYSFMKNTAESYTGVENATNFPVVLAPSGGWVIGILVEKIDDEAVVFIPGSPNPRVGRVVIFKQSDLRQTTMTQMDAMRHLRQNGVGLKDLQLKVPSERGQ